MLIYYTLAGVVKLILLCSILCAQPRARHWLRQEVWHRPGKVRLSNAPIQYQDSKKKNENKNKKSIYNRRLIGSSCDDVKCIHLHLLVEEF